MRSRATVAWAAIAVILSGTSGVFAAENAALFHAAQTITAGELQSHVDVLADDSFEGREAGSRGGRAAGVYLVTKLEQSGLLGAGVDGSFFQPFGNGYRNIVGILEGSDPDLRRQYIVLGAHYDHVGYGARGNSFGPFGYVHNGADDNASGTAGLLETIDAILTLPERPRRSILVAFWDGEEKGLLGSKHWTANPTVPTDRITAMINVDMIGRLRNDELKVYGSRTGVGLRRLVSRNNFDSALSIDFDWELKANSDHHPFAARKIPVLMFHTGLHDNYHRPSDDAHLVNAAGMQKAARLMFHVTYSLANRADSIAFRQQCWREGPNRKRQFERPLKPMVPRLGVGWAEDAGESNDGLQLDNVETGSAAFRAGLRRGDALITFNGEPVTSPQQFRLAVLRAPSSVTATVRRPGADEVEQLEITLDGKPTRIGFAWREPENDPGVVILTRVVHGSPAQLAGLRLRDRIYEVNGQPYADGAELFELLTTLPGPIEVTAERNGRLQVATMDVPAPLAN